MIQTWLASGEVHSFVTRWRRSSKPNVSCSTERSRLETSLPLLRKTCPASEGPLTADFNPELEFPHIAIATRLAF
jgi:hypothetical protein